MIRSKAIEAKRIQLENENKSLRQQVELAKRQLIALETKNGKKQIPIPGSHAIQSTPVVQSVATTASPNSTATVKPAKEKKQKEKKVAVAVTAPTAVNASADDAPIDISRIDLRIGKIVEIQKHPDADSLYVEKIDLGEAKLRTIVSGLVKHVPIDEMLNRIVCVMCNLKPAKMRGVTSEGMVMCASSPDKVEVLTAPSNCVPGDLVHCEGYNRTPDAQLNPKKKIFETVAPDLKTNDELVACYKGNALHVPGKGVLKATTLKNVNVK